MIRKITILICFLLAVALTSACDSNSKYINNQIELHKDFNGYLLESLNKVKSIVDAQVLFVLNNYSTRKCVQRNYESSDSSVYFPKSAIINDHACFYLRAAKNLDSEWLLQYKKNKYISWLYIYDSNSKVLKIHPATNPSALFGEDLLFDNFNFFKGPVESYPEGAWSKPKEDINGTGRIMIYSKAIKFPNSNAFTVIAVDVRLKHFIDKYLSSFINLVKMNISA